MAQWLNQSVNRLVRRGHSLQDIAKYTWPKFQMCLEAARQNDAQDRLSFVSDMTAVVGSMFSDSKPSPMTLQVESLEDAAAGVIENGPEPKST
jgi:predicted nucleotidyltransferase component of viral defense system